VKDKEFIREMVRRGEEARIKVKNAFEPLSVEQLDWKPADGSWSIGQCLDHLIITDCRYFPVLKKITERKYTMNIWEKWSPFSGMFGKVLLNAVEEKQVRKTKTARIFTPHDAKIDAVIFERFYKHLDSLLGYISACEELNIDRVRISSPVSKVVTYSLRKAILILIEHEHRHIRQALRVKADKNFPTNIQ
jgi:uncharacterized damage-inducible protein DinB